MKLAIDAVGIKGGGGAVVLEEVLAAVAGEPAVDEAVVFVSPVASRDFQLPHHAKVVAIECPAAESSRLIRAIWHERLLDIAVSKHRAQALLCLCSMGRSRRIPYVTFVQQSLPYSTEAMRRLSRRKVAALYVMKQMIGRSCRNAAGVFVQTETMARWLSKAHSIPSAKFRVFVPAARVAVQPNSRPSCGHPMDAYPEGARLLYVGNAEGYKNLSVIVNAMPALLRRRPSSRLFLTIPACHSLCRHEGVVGLGTLNADTLAGAYARATLLVQPSLAETVGLPLLEAMSHGVAIVAADRPYAREICGDAAVYFNPLFSGAFVDAVERVLSDRLVQERLRRSARRRSAELADMKPYESMITAVTRLVSESESRSPSC